jgi:hypothetical protein
VGTYDAVLDLPQDVVVQKTSVQRCLSYGANINDPVVSVEPLVIGSIHPVHYVKSPIGA